MATDLVDPAEIEAIVGVTRHSVLHFGRLVTAEETVYILHSQYCVDSGIDLRKCEFSQALDRGIYLEDWTRRHDLDRPVVLGLTRLLHEQDTRERVLVPMSQIDTPGVATELGVALVPSSKQPGTTTPKEKP